MSKATWNIEKYTKTNFIVGQRTKSMRFALLETTDFSLLTGEKKCGGAKSGAKRCNTWKLFVTTIYERTSGSSNKKPERAAQRYPVHARFAMQKGLASPQCMPIKPIKTIASRRYKFTGLRFARTIFQTNTNCPSCDAIETALNYVEVKRRKKKRTKSLRI